MRVWLSRDPRVIRMADYLSENRAFMNWLTDPVRQSCKESAYEHVTRNVIVSLCVTGLLVTWGTAREQGDRNDDDLVLTHCDKYTFDAITDIEAFGEAMEHVGWLIDDDNGSVILPKFFKDMESPDEKHKRQNAERQAAFRAKQQANNNVNDNVTNNVTVTLEKRREEKRKTTTLVGNDVTDCPHEQIIKLYEKNLPMLTQIAKWTDTRSRLLKTRWREDKKRQTLEWWDRFFAYISKSKFLTGAENTGRPWQADIDWILKESNFIKIIEGKYHGTV